MGDSSTPSKGKATLEESALAEEGNPFREDVDLAQRVLQRESAASQEFYDRFAPPLLRRLYRLVSDPVEAEECLQQVFFQALRKLAQYRGEGPLGGWLNRIASHVALSHLQRKHRWVALSESFWSGIRDSKEPEPPLQDELFLRRERQQFVWQMIQRLSPQKRLAVIVCDLEGRTIEEAAQELDLPMGTLISRLYSGRRELRALFERESQRQGLSTGDWMDD